MNFKNIKTDTMLQYYRHGSKAGFVKHMDVYLKSITEDNEYNTIKLISNIGYSLKLNRYS